MPPSQQPVRLGYDGPLTAGAITEGRSYRTVRPGGTDDWLMIQTVEGAGRFGTVDAVAVAAGAGSVVLIPPGTPQDYGTDPAVGRWALRFVHVRVPPAWNPLLRWPEAGAGVRMLAPEGEAAGEITAHLDAVVRWSRSGWSHGTDLALNALHAALLWAEAINPEHGQVDPRIRAVVDAIERDHRRPWSVAEMAAQARLSPSRFAHLFAAEMGTTPAAFVEGRRMDLARQLLTVTQLPVAEVAAEVGFEDPFYFSQRFRRAVGVSPREHRRRHAP